MANRKDIIQNASQQQWQQQWQQDNKSQTNWKNIINNTNTNWTQSIKQSLEEVDKWENWFIQSFASDVKWFFGDIWDLVSYWWTELVSNKDKKKWINDWDEYKKRMKQMSETTSQEEYQSLYNKMVQDNIIDEPKYKQYQEDEKAWEYYKFEQAKTADKQTFFDKLDKELSPIMQNTTNRYQIDALSKWLQKIESQYSMFYDNVMETYKDTRDERILNEWDKIRREYENDILQFTKSWANNLVNNNMTYWEAYNKTLRQWNNEEFANWISKIERQLSNKMFKFTINQNLTDAWDAIWTFNLLKWINQWLLAAKNGITWAVKQVSNLLEEWKQLTWRYDVVEELMNLRVFDENASWFEKAIWNVNWFVNTMIDSLPAYWPAVIELILARKIEPGLLKNTNKLMDLWKAWDFKRFGSTLGWVTLKELALDNLIYDEVFQNMIGRPISNEDENINLMFNIPIDFLQWALQANARWLKPAMKASDFALDAISPEMLKIIKTSWDTAEDIKRLWEKVYLLRGLETTEWTKEFKNFNKWNLVNLEEIKNSNEKLYNKITKALDDASGYWDRLTKYEWNAEDLLLWLEETLSRKEISKLSTIEKLDKASEKVWRQSKLMTEAWDNLLLWAKTVGKTIWDIIRNWTVNEDQLKLIIKNITPINWMDNLIIGLAKWDKDAVNNALVDLVNNWVELSAGDVNQLYNNILAKLLKDNPDLQELSQIGTYYKWKDGLYRNILWDDTKYSVTELINKLSETNKESIIWSEPVSLIDWIQNRITLMSREQLANPNAELTQNMTDIFSKLQGWNLLRNWDAKSEADKKMISELIKWGWFELRKVDWWVDVYWTLDNLQTLLGNIEWLSSKSLLELNAEDINAYKLLYASEFINSFNKYLAKVWNLDDVDRRLVEKWLKQPNYNSLDFQKEYKTWFESMFDIREIKDQKGKTQKVYALKSIYWNKDISSEFNNLITNNATFKDIEAYAANNIIKNITEEAINLWQNDNVLYNNIKKALTEWHYAKGYEREILPVVNSIFNQVKRLSSLWVDATDASNVIWKLFSELVVDEWTLKSLSKIDSDYLYKWIISKLLLNDDKWFAIYTDALRKEFDKISWIEDKVLLKSLMNNVETLWGKIRLADSIKVDADNFRQTVADIDKQIKEINKQTQGKYSKWWKKEITKLETKKEDLVRQFNRKYWPYIKDGGIDIFEPYAIQLDRQWLISKLQWYVDDIQSDKFINTYNNALSKFEKSKKFKKVWLNVNNNWVTINRIASVSDDDLRMLSDLVAYKSFSNVGLPMYWEASKMSDEIYSQLLALKQERDIRNIYFNLNWTNKLAKDWINIDLYWEAKLISNILSPEGWMKYIIANTAINWWKANNTEWINWLRKQLEDIKIVWWKEITDDYLILLNNIEKFIKYWDTPSEKLKSIINSLNWSALLDTDKVIDDLIRSFEETSNWWARNMDSLISDMSFIEQLNNTTAKVEWIIADLYTASTLYNNVLNEADKKAVSEITKKLQKTTQLFDRMQNAVSNKWNITPQEIKKILSTNFSNDELTKKSWEVYKGINPLTDKKSWSTKVDFIRRRGGNKVDNNFDVTKPTYNLWNRKLVIYDLETTSLKKDADVLQLSYIVVSQDSKWNIKIDRHNNNLFDTDKKLEAEWLGWLTKDKLKWKPHFKDTAWEWGEYDKFKALAEDDNTIFVWHNIRGYDNEVLENSWIHINDDRTIDTLNLYKALFADNKSYKLEDAPNNIPNIKKALEWKAKWTVAHNADYDTLNNYYLFNYLANHADINDKVDNLFDDFIDVSKEQVYGSYEDTSTSLLQRQLFTEKKWVEKLNWANSVIRKLDNKGLKEKEELWIDDLLPYLWSRFGTYWNEDSKYIALFEWLKRILPENATINKNKIFVWWNVKKAYEAYVAEVWFDAMSLDEFVINRTINSLLTTYWLYNDTTIEALNNFIKRTAKQDITRRLVEVPEKWFQAGKLIWSTDTIAVSQLLEKLFDDNLLWQWIQKNSVLYQDMMKEILDAIKKYCDTDLRQFNKSYYNYILTNDWRGGYRARAIFSNIMDKLFEKKSFDIVDEAWNVQRKAKQKWVAEASEEWLFDVQNKLSQYWTNDQEVNLVWQYSRSSSNAAQAKPLIDELEGRIAELNKERDEILKKHSSISPSTEEWRQSRKRLFDYKRELDSKIDELEDELYEYKEFWGSFSNEYVLDDEWLRQLDSSIEKKSDEPYELNRDDKETFDIRDEIEEATDEEIKEWENFVNQYDEDVSTADRLRTSRDTNVSDVFESYIWEWMLDDIINKSNLEMSNKFFIEETDDTVRNFKWTQFNTAISIEARLDEDNKWILIDTLNKLTPKEWSSEKEFAEWANAFISNATKYLNGKETAFTDEQYLKTYWLDNILNKKLKDWEVIDVKIWGWYYDKDKASSLNTNFVWDTFDIDDDDILYKMLDIAVNATKKESWTFTVDLIHKTYKENKEYPTSIQYTLDELRTSPIGKYLLNKMNISEEVWKYWPEAVLKTISNKIYNTALDEKIKWDKLKSMYLDIINIVDNEWNIIERRWPRKKRSEEVMIDALDLSKKTKWKYVNQLTENSKKNILNEIKKSYTQKLMKEEKVTDDKELSSNARNILSHLSLEKEGDLEEYFSQGLYSYEKLDDIAKWEWYKSMWDFIYQTELKGKWKDEAFDELWWSLMWDNWFRAEVYNRYDSNLVKLYDSIQDYFWTSVDAFQDRMKNFRIYWNDWQVKYTLEAYMPDFLEVSYPYDGTISKLSPLGRWKKWNVLLEDFGENLPYRDYEEIQLIHSNKWLSVTNWNSEDMLNDIKRGVERSNEYNELKNVNDPSEVVVRMYNNETWNFEYWILKITPHKYSKESAEATTYSFYPFKWDNRYTDPLILKDIWWENIELPTWDTRKILDRYKELSKQKKPFVNKEKDIFEWAFIWDWDWFVKVDFWKNVPVRTLLSDPTLWKIDLWNWQKIDVPKKIEDKLIKILSEDKRIYSYSNIELDWWANAIYKWDNWYIISEADLNSANKEFNWVLERRDKAVEKIEDEIDKLNNELKDIRSSSNIENKYKKEFELEQKIEELKNKIKDMWWTWITLKDSKKVEEWLPEFDYDAALSNIWEREWPIMKYNWKKSTFVEAQPAGMRKNTIVRNETTIKDWDNIADMDMLSRSTNWLWNTRQFSNWTNYDFYDQDKTIQQIVWERTRFITNQWENLKNAIDNFNTVLEKQNYNTEETLDVYRKIRQVAQTYIWKQMWDAKELKVEWLPEELVEALNWICKVFDDWWWTPVHQLATLSKDWFDGIIKNIAHNHYWTALNYFKVWSREKVKSNLLWIIKQYEPREKQALNAVEDLMWDPLGTWAFYNLLTGIRSMWRFIKYWPLFPLTWVLMLANSTVMWTIRYAWEKRWVQALMDNPRFNALITKAWDAVNINWKEIKWLWMTDGLNRANEIMFNSNSDLGWSWFDKVLDLVVKPLPEGKTKTAVQTALKGWTHSLYDLAAQWSVKTMAFAKALAKNWISVNNIEDFVKAYQNKLVSNAELNKILWDTERIYSRFFTNSATSFFSRHRFSRRYAFNALQWYVVNRTDEMVSSIKNCVNWLYWRHQLAVQNWYKWLDGTTWRDFVDYLQTDNQELQSFLMNILFSTKMGFYMEKMVDWWDMDTENYRRYIIDSSDYLSSIEANFIYSILMSPFEAITDYAEYAQNNYDDFDLWQWLTVAWLKTVSDLCSKFFREGKVLNAFMDSVVAYWQTWKVDFAYDVLIKDFQKIADWLWRFQLVEWTNLYWLDTLWEDRDMLWQILFNNDMTSNSWRITSKLQSLSTVDSILNWEDGSFWKDKLLPYLPVIWPAIQNAVVWNWYSFSAAKYDELIHILDKDKVVQALNNWDYETSNPIEIFGNSNIYSDEAIWRMYQELTAFDYTNKQQLSWWKFETWYEYSNEPLKEEVFTKEMLDELWWTEQGLEQYLLDNSNWKNKQAGLFKIMAAAEASRPGSSKIVLWYLANQYENARIKEITWDKYWSRRDLSVQAQNDIQRETVAKYYPYMFTADKTSWYKAITEYVSWKYELFDTLYKDDNLQWYVNTLGYMDMLMYQQAQDWNTNAKFIKNSWSMLSKYFKSEPARINAINYIMDSIEKSWMSAWQATSAKMGVLAANMDFYDKYYKNWMAQALYGDDLERYNNYVWWVLQDINNIWLENIKSQGKGWNWYWYSYKNPYSTSNPLWENNVPMARQFVPAAQKYLNWYTPSWYSKYKPQTYTPGKDLDWYWKYYEGLIKDYSDKLVKGEGKKYPAQTIEGMTFKTGSNNRWSIKWQQLSFPKHKSKQYRTNVLSNLPGSHW